MTGTVLRRENACRQLIRTERKGDKVAEREAGG